MSPDKGELRRTILLEAAEQVLITSGNATATMRNFAAAADVSLGHLQHYFPTRSDLMQALLHSVLQRALASMRKATGVDLSSHSADPGSREDTRRIAAAVVQQQSDPATVRLYVEIWALAASDDTIATVLREFYGEFTRYVEIVVERGRPGLDAPERQGRARAVVAILEGVVITNGGFTGLKSAEANEYLLDAIVQTVHGA